MPSYLSSYALSARMAQKIKSNRDELLETKNPEQKRFLYKNINQLESFFNGNRKPN